MTTLITITIITIMIIVLVFTFALINLASEVDRLDEEMYQEWKQQHPDK